MIYFGMYTNTKFFYDQNSMTKISHEIFWWCRINAGTVWVIPHSFSIIFTIFPAELCTPKKSEFTWLHKFHMRYDDSQSHTSFHLFIFSFALHSNSLKLYWLNIGICMIKEQIHAIFVTRKICSTYDLKLVIKIKFCVFLRLMSHFVCIESITIDFIHIPIRWIDFFPDWV